MKRIALLAGILCLAACAVPSEKTAQNDGERYFGLHFDFHASPSPDSEANPVGGTLKEDDIREICEKMGIDFLQVDCKGHPGWASYPTKCGNAMPYFSGDPLKTWRKVTKEEDVKLFLHYSGVWDFKYATENPSEAVMFADGTRSTQGTRTNGKYVDELLIPQLKELAGDYDIDGMWIDGECWGIGADFSPETIAAFEKETGINLGGILPFKRGMPYFDEYRDFNRDMFRKYLNHYVDELHAAYPDFKIASNWAFTDHMPEKVCANVDFISGDFTPEDSYWWARYSGRSIEKQGLPWDLMAWGFRHGGYFAYKSPAQMMQEAAAVISLGGGFQIYIPQKRDGSPRIEQVRELYPLADFMKARREWCFNGHPDHQVAVLLSTYDRYKESSSLFSRNGCEKAMNLVNLLCDAGHSVTIVSEHDLIDGKIDSYPVIAVPELYAGLEDSVFELLKGYVENGGNLLLNGSNTCKLFAERGLPCKLSDTKGVVNNLAISGLIWNEPTLENMDGDVLASLDNGQELMAVRDFGKGKVTAICCDLAKMYSAHGMSLITGMADEALMKMYEPEVHIESSVGSLEIVDLRKDGKLLVQLINTNGLHHAANRFTEESIPPVCDICLRIKLDKKPSALRLQPEGKKLSFKWSDGYACVSVPRVDIHSVLEVVE